MFIIIIPDLSLLGESVFESGDTYTWERLCYLYNSSIRVQCMLTVYDLEEEEFCSIFLGDVISIQRDVFDLTEVEVQIVLSILRTPEHILMKFIANRELITQFPIFYKLVKARVVCKF